MPFLTTTTEEQAIDAAHQLLTHLLEARRTGGEAVRPFVHLVIFDPRETKGSPSLIRVEVGKLPTAQARRHLCTDLATQKKAAFALLICEGEPQFPEDHPLRDTDEGPFLFASVEHPFGGTLLGARVSDGIVRRIPDTEMLGEDWLNLSGLTGCLLQVSTEEADA